MIRRKKKKAKTVKAKSARVKKRLGLTKNQTVWLRNFAEDPKTFKAMKKALMAANKRAGK
jgi:hypothetical protein